MQVLTIARPTSDTGHLESVGAEIHRGQLTDADFVRGTMQGVDYVFHCAAKVGDWGPIEDYRTVNVEALRSMLEVCRQIQVKRFVHLGSLGVYPAEHHYGSDETYPLPEKHMDAYTQTKLEAEKLVLQFHQEHQLPIVVLRPGFIYGPRDRTLFPPLIENLRKRNVRYIGSGKLLMNCIYASNLIEPFFQAIERESAIGQVYNLTDDEQVTKRRFIETICEGFGLPYPRPVPAPLWLAKMLAWWQEGRARKRGDAHPPRITKARIKLMGLNLHFSIEKAKSELGYRPPYSFEEAMKETIHWFKENSSLVQSREGIAESAAS